MTNFSFLSLARLYNLAKTEVYNKKGGDLVYISSHISNKYQLQESYAAICELYHQGEAMTYKKLFDFLELKNKNVRVTL